MGPRELQKLAAEFKAAETRIPQARLKGVSRQLGESLRLFLMQPAASWEHKPKMTVKSKATTKAVTITVSVWDQPYIYVTMGTRAHVIRAKHAPRLVFSSGYSAKTSPNSLAGTSGGQFGDIVYAIQVFHPGSAARNFHVVAVEKMAPVVERVLITVLKQELAHIKSVI